MYTISERGVCSPRFEKNTCRRNKHILSTYLSVSTNAQNHASFNFAVWHQRPLYNKVWSPPLPAAETSGEQKRLRNQHAQKKRNPVRQVLKTRHHSGGGGGMVQWCGAVN